MDDLKVNPLPELASRPTSSSQARGDRFAKGLAFRQVGMSSQSSRPQHTHHNLAKICGSNSFLRALIILNGPSLPGTLLTETWPRPPTRIILADGAANRLRQEYPTLIPTHIAGDLDSIAEGTLSHYRSLGVSIHQDTDQYRNDFEKSLDLAKDAIGSGPIAVIGGHDGRFDQTLANLNVLLTASTNGIPLVWLQPSTVVTALSPGEHLITVDSSREGPACGLLPVYTPVSSVTTTGLRWNLSHQPLRFGGLISSSNLADAETVTVETSDPILWTLELRITE